MLTLSFTSYSAEKQNKKSFFSSKLFKNAVQSFKKDKRKSETTLPTLRQKTDTTSSQDIAQKLLFEEEYLCTYRYQIREYILETEQLAKLQLLKEVLQHFELHPNTRCYNLYCQYLKTDALIQDYNTVTLCLQNYSKTNTDNSKLKEQLQLLCDTLQAFCKQRGCE